jgi:hypothetical protein
MSASVVLRQICSNRTVPFILTIATASRHGYALLRDQEAGSPRAGKLADVTILSVHWLTAKQNRINREVWVMMVGQRVENCAPGHQALRPAWQADRDGVPASRFLRPPG